MPIEIERVRAKNDASGKTSLFIRFKLKKNVTYTSLGLNRLTLYLAGNLKNRYTLLHYLVDFTTSISVRELTSDSEGSDSDFEPIQGARVDIPELTRELDEDEERYLLPYTRQSFTGYRLLQEYFAFPERFFFVEINGLDAFNASEDGHPFELKIKFSRALPPNFEPTTKDFDINCVPIINLFEGATEQVPVNQRKSEYPVIPRSDRLKSREMYAIKNVTGVLDKNRAQYHYFPVTSYDTLDVGDPVYASKRFYSVMSKFPGGDLMGETSIRLFGESIDGQQFPRETLSVQAIMSNGDLPGTKVKAKDISIPMEFPEGLAVENATVPTVRRACPSEKNFLWALISHLSVNFSTLTDIKILKTLLGLYNWPVQHQDNDNNRKKIQNGIIEIHEPKQVNIPIDFPDEENEGRMRRIYARGLELRFDIDKNQFEYGEGDVFLFCLVLTRFLSQYVTINSALVVKLVDKITKEEYSWEPTAGKISII